jgi:hypothetical protein
MSQLNKMAKFKHENLVLDMTYSSKARLYLDDRLLFFGDSYKALTMMIRCAKNKEPIVKHFKKQLEMREKPKFSKDKDLEYLKKQTIEEMNKHEKAKNSKKR